jgi:hypothetical protein
MHSDPGAFTPLPPGATFTADSDALSCADAAPPDGKARAPFTPEQVESLNAYQRSGDWHPFTCGRCGAALAADTHGWLCPTPACLYQQDWAHPFMADWSWRRVPVGGPPAPDDDPDDASAPGPPQSCAEAAAHCLHLLESLLAEECVRVAWAAAEGLVAAARAEMREACAKVAEDWGWSDKPDHAHGIAEAIRALPLEVPR